MRLYLHAELEPEHRREVASYPVELRATLAVSGLLVHDDKHSVVVLRMGDDRVHVTPLTAFEPSGISAPMFDAFALTDHGATIAFGVYEASTEAAVADAINASEHELLLIVEAWLSYWIGHPSIWPIEVALSFLVPTAPAPTDAFLTLLS